MEHDIVTSKHKLKGIPKKTKGTIVFVYDCGVYDVEFIVNGTSLIRTMRKDDVNYIKK